MRKTHRVGMQAIAAMVAVVAAVATTTGSAGASEAKDPPTAWSKYLTPLYKGTFARPPTSGPRAQPDKNVWVLSAGQIAPSNAIAARAVVDAGKVLGWNMTLFDGQFSPSRYGDGVRQAVAAQADGIVLLAFDCRDVAAPLAEAKNAGIKIVGLYSLDCSDPNVGGQSLFTSEVVFGKAWPSYAAFVRGWGAAKAQYLVGTLRGNVRAVEFTFDNALALKHQRIGFEAALAKCRTCKIVSKIQVTPADFSSTTALRALTASALQQHPDANAIYYQFDSQALSGPAAAIVESGRAMVAVGGEGYRANIDLIRTGRGQTAAMAFPTVWAGWATADTMNRMFAGVKAAPEGLGFQAVDRGHNLPRAGRGWQAPVDFRAAYKAVWGRK